MAEQFILTSIWKHEKQPIDKQTLRNYLAIVRSELDPNGELWLENIWYRIDDYTHGSISFYASEEAYKKMLDRIEAQRNVADDLKGITLVQEYKGIAFAVMSEVSP